MPTYLSTPTANYALGRNTTLTLTFLAPVGSVSYTSVTMEICISQGQVSMDTDTIEIASNCQSGWKVKLPGLISGTVTGTGYVASSNVTSTGNALSLRTDPINLLQFLGQPAAVTISAETTSRLIWLRHWQTLSTVFLSRPMFRFLLTMQSKWILQLS
jgi:hypothetical protein